MKYIIKFEEVKQKDSIIIGNKAYYLTRLFKHHFPVPKGIIITTESFQLFLKANFLEFLHKTLSKDISVKDSLFIASQLKEKIIKGTIPTKLRNIIINSVNQLDFNEVSVRSSATVEDSKNGSFAGQFESYLNVKKKNILNNVLKCWASLFSDRVIVYSKRKNIYLDQAQMAVMIHEMINPEVAGNIFTIDVINKNKHFLLIEAVPGGGNKVTDGTGKPKRILINRNDLSFKDKPKVIDENILKKLAKIAFKIEKTFQYPQDIEWAISKNKIYILQSRPITII